MTDPSTWAPPGSGAATPASEAPAAPEPAPVESDELEIEIPLRPLGVSEILDAAVTCIRRSPRATLGMSAVLTGVVEILITLAQYYVVGSIAHREATPAVLQRSVGWAFLTLLADQILTAYIVLLLSGLLAPVMARFLLGRSTSLGEAWRIARPYAPRLLGVATLVLVAGLLAITIPVIPAILTLVLGAPAPLQAVAWLFGALAAIVLLVLVTISITLAAPILILERRGVIASLRRSAEIVRGRWWRTFGILFLSLVIAALAGIVLPAPFGIAQQIVLQFDSNPTGWVLVGLYALGAVGNIVVGTLANPFNAGVITLAYTDRRMRREAFDLELQLDPPDDPLSAWLPGPLTAAGSGRQPKVPRKPLVAPPPPPQYPPPGWSR